MRSDRERTEQPNDRKYGEISMKQNVFRIRIKQEILDKYKECQNDRLRQKIRKYIEEVINNEYENDQLLKQVTPELCLANDPDFDNKLMALQGKTYGVNRLGPDPDTLYHFFKETSYLQYKDIDWVDVHCPICQEKNTWPTIIWDSQGIEYQLKCRKCDMVFM